MMDAGEIVLNEDGTVSVAQNEAGQGIIRNDKDY